MTTNFPLAQSLLWRAARCLSESRDCLTQSDWNLTIRRSQECVELALKGLLRASGWEVPKRQDVSDFVIECLQSCGLGVEPEIATRIKKVSQTLAEKRAPAFYGETAFERSDAEAALRDAEFVLTWTQMMLTKLQRSLLQSSLFITKFVGAIETSQ